MATLPSSPDDARFMHYALRLAHRGLGQTWPNPSVGCVLVKEGQIIGAARTGYGGAPHAETAALEQAASRARGATAYVTLEPCAHHGTTPPCADALVKAGVTRVVIACTDPDERVNGQGIARLKDAGIDVAIGICETEASGQHAGFFLRIRHNRPLVTLKIATSLDGMIATSSGESQWITSEDARAHGHLLRARHDAVLTGIGTVMADNPALTCRLPGLGHASPVRVVLDSQLRLPPDCQLAKNPSAPPVWLLTTAKTGHDTIQTATLPADASGRVDLPAALGWLAEQGITRLLVEGGANVNAAFINAGLVDRLYWYRAPIVIGGNGLPAIAGLGETALANLPGFTRDAVRTLGKDVLEIYNRN